LLFGVGFCHQRARLAPAETQPPEQPLALTDTERDLILDLKLAQSSLPAKAEQAIGYMRNYL
jgi:hypothetical protein